MSYQAPMIVRETSNGYFRYSIEEEMLTKREVECVGEINQESAYALTRQLRWLEREDPNAEITMIINSTGGEVCSGLALYDVMRSLSCPIRTVCLGTAASMAAVLFAAGTRRDILPHSRVMIHDPLLSGSPGGSALQMQAVSDRLLETRKEVCGILAQCTGRSLQQIYRKTSKDTWFTAQQAVDFGLADRIVEKI